MLDRVIEILSEFTMLDREQISESSELIGDLGLNSLDVVNLIVAFEDAFDIEIPDSNIKNFVTVGDIVRYLEGHV